MALSDILKSRLMVKLFLYASAIALFSWVFVASLFPVFILNFMQLGVQPLSVEMIPCRIAFFLPDLVFHKS